METEDQAAATARSSALFPYRDVQLWCHLGGVSAHNPRRISILMLLDACMKPDFVIREVLMPLKFPTSPYS